MPSNASDPRDLEDFLAREFPRLDRARPLMAQLTSIEFVELVNALESRYGVRFNLLDLDADHFADARSVRSLILASGR